ncbi:hypothetical protein N0V83_008522 [Neocucurbitaria cava]|uniref:CRAL/TRIO N-terminal domain-containing protein n=1 Tax=Neocucurbitaria cava TaxID=798079 RepID=A0A9W9CIV7_9PLEO|nr:hypothetical protein N0V83_008522 [Neocucurbitaria cava]
MLRFLRARRFIAPEAFKQFKDTEDWRKENHLSEIFNTIETEEFEQTRRLVHGPAYSAARLCLTAARSIPSGSVDATSAAFPSFFSKSRP